MSAHERPDRGLSGHEQPDGGLAGHERPDRGLSAHEQPDRGLSGHERPDRGLSAHEQSDRGLSGYERPDRGLSGHERPDRGLSAHEQPADDQPASEVAGCELPGHKQPARESFGRGLLVSLAVAVAAAVALVVAGPATDPAPPPPGRVDAATAWPGARRADLDPAMPDGPLFTPVLFLDTTTALGTAPTPDARSVRLLLRTGDGEPRELRRVPLDGNPHFEAVTAAGDDLVWSESADNRPGTRLWHARRSGGPARLLTADTGNVLFYGNQDDLVIADGRVHWASAPLERRDQQPPPRTAPTPSWAGPTKPAGYDTFSPPSTAGGGKSTEVRSVSLAGGPVAVRTEPGEWAMSAWPWLYDEQEGRLRNLATGRDRRIVTAGPQTVTCSPAWCRVMVMKADGLARIDLMRPDGSARRQIAGGAAQAAVTDVAVLDRFEILAEPGPDADVTGTVGLLVYDVATGRTVDIAKNVDGAFTGGGMLWWSTGGTDDAITWHALDLRTA